jgi:hypothetical protein
VLLAGATTGNRTYGTGCHSFIFHQAMPVFDLHSFKKKLTLVLMMNKYIASDPHTICGARFYLCLEHCTTGSKRDYLYMMGV